MKKKGRICGTIGLILSLALAGGTVIYSTMFDKNAVGKAEKPFGAATTGSVFNRKGFDETKKLVDETEGLLLGTQKDGTYKSFSLNWTQHWTQLWTTKEQETYLIDHTSEFVYFTDANYTYIKGTSRDARQRTIQIDAFEYVLDKVNSVWYERTNYYVTAEKVTDDTRGKISDLPFEKAADVPLLDKAKWKIIEDENTFKGIKNITTFEALRKSFTSLSDDNKLKIDPTGIFSFKDTANFANYARKPESEIKFTVGIVPTIYRSYYLADVKVNVANTFAYSNLNNTKVSLPDSLKKAMEAK